MNFCRGLRSHSHWPETRSSHIHANTSMCTWAKQTDFGMGSDYGRVYLVRENMERQTHCPTLIRWSALLNYTVPVHCFILLHRCSLQIHIHADNRLTGEQTDMTSPLVLRSRSVKTSALYIEFLFVWKCRIFVLRVHVLWATWRFHRKQ